MIKILSSRRIGFAPPVILSLTLLPLAAHAATKDACNLFASDDAQIAIGDPVGPSKTEDRSSGAGPASSCRYRSILGHSIKSKSVSLEVRYSATDLTGSASGISQNLKSAGFSSVHEVAGVGSAAIWGSNSILGKYQGELTVIHGKSVMLIVIINGIPNDADALARAKVIAAKAIAKL